MQTMKIENIGNVSISIDDITVHELLYMSKAELTIFSYLTSTNNVNGWTKIELLEHCIGIVTK